MKAAWIKLQPFVETMRDIFGAVGDALGKVWTWLSVHIPPAIDAVKGAFEDAQVAISNVADAISNIIDLATTALDKINALSGASAGGAAISQSAASGNPALAGLLASNPVLAAIYGLTNQTRNATSANNRGMGNVTINVNAPGGNPGAVSRAAQSGVLAAARSMGMR
jgi:hypothetical protein